MHKNNKNFVIKYHHSSAFTRNYKHSYKPALFLGSSSNYYYKKSINSLE